MNANRWVQPQAVSAFVSMCLLITAAIVALGSGAKPNEIPVLGTSSDARLEVRPADGTPQATSELIQGSSSLQTEVGSIEASNNATTDVLQPNSGHRSFLDQRSEVQ